MKNPNLIPLADVIAEHRKDPVFRELWDMQTRLDRIAEAHTMRSDEHGGVSGCCPECDLVHPCPTYVWATTERDPLSTWDPEYDNDNDNEDNT